MKQMTQGNQELLVIEGGREWSLGRWISSQLLAQGMYCLEARVRCEGVTPYANDRNGGFRLRQRSDAQPHPDWHARVECAGHSLCR